MKHKLGFLLVYLFFILGGTALGDTVLTLTGAGGPTGNNLGGAYVAPYAGTLNPGVAALGSEPLQLICDDFAHDVSVGNSWNVQVIQFSPSADLSNTRFDNAVLYEEVFYLIDEMNFSSTTPSTLLQNAELQWAVWDLTSTNPPIDLSSYISNPTYLSAIQGYVTDAQEDYLNGQNYSNFYIITPSPLTAPLGQEYITLDAPPDVSEPSSMASLCAAGLSLLFFRRKLSLALVS